MCMSALRASGDSSKDRHFRHLGQRRDDFLPSRGCIFPGPSGRTTMEKSPKQPVETNGVTRRGLIKGIASVVGAASAGATTLLVEARHELEAANANGAIPVSVA